MLASIPLGLQLNSEDFERVMYFHIFILEEAFMKICKVTLISLLSLILISILSGAGWRPIMTIHDVVEPPQLYPPGLAVDNIAIHSGMPNMFKCGNVAYIRSDDDGSEWTYQYFNAEPGQSYGSPPPVYIASNSPLVHYFTYLPPSDIINIRTSSNYGITWPEDWSELPSSPRTSSAPTSCRLENCFYTLWSDRLTPDNDELFFMITDDGGNSWYSYDTFPSNSQRLTFADGKSMYPDAVVNNYGIHLVWADNRLFPSSSTEYEIYYKYSTDGGQTWSEDFPLTVDQQDSSFYPAIATYGNGLHVVFQDKRDGENLIYYKRSLDNGQSWEEEYVIGGGTNPDISADGNGLYVVYEYNGSIRYRRSSDFGNTWTWHPNGMNISYDITNPDTFYNYLPRICADFRGQHVVWYNRNIGLRYRQYDILTPIPPRDLRIKYIVEYETDQIVICLDWASNKEPDLAGYDLYRRSWCGNWQKINSELITENAYFDTIPNNEVFVYYVVAVDQVVNISDPSNFIVYWPPDYKSDIGKTEPSIYLIERDSFIEWENNSVKTADIDNNQLIYRFHNLSTNMTYELGVVYYRGDDEERTEVLKIDGVEFQEVEVLTTPEMYVFRIPNNIYADGEIYIYFEKLLGPNVVVSEVYLWEFYTGGGGQSGGKTDYNQFEFTLQPNIIKNATTISYTSPLQSQVSLNVYNSSGRLVRTLVNELADNDNYQIQWDGKDEKNRSLPAGVYLVQLSVDNIITTKRLLVVR